MKNKHQKKQSNTVKQKAMIESLIFQTNWGIKKLYKNPSDLISTLVKVELEYIIELNLFEDLLLLKMFIENVKSVFGVEPIAEYGDFNRSLVALALGIGKVNDIEKVGIPIAWHELLEKRFSAYTTLMMFVTRLLIMQNITEIMFQHSWENQ